MKKQAFIFICALSFGCLPFFSYAATNGVVISEVLFDPTGTDTGLEYVAIKNIGSNAADLTGWHLYPDGVGYFTFPSFTLASDAIVKIYIRGSGTDSGNILYFSDTSGNMGNSSGAIALFSSSTHSSDTIVSYVRYHKPGSSEHKTWESSAASAGVWTLGSYIDLSSFTEGQAVVLSDESNKTSARGWIVEDDGSSSDNNVTSPSTSSNSSVPPSAYSAPAVESKIKVYGGTDISAVAGSSVVFNASAEDFSGQPLDGARFLWNFGDGTYQEGRSVTHIFRYPGKYTAVVDASAGMNAASDRVTVSVIENPVIISEIMPSQAKGFFASLVSSDHGGWVEFYNEMNSTVDISGIGITFDDAHTFFFPAHSTIAGHSVVVIGDATLGFDVPKKGFIKILYANGSLMAVTAFDAAAVGSGQSVVRFDDAFVVATATPGVLSMRTGARSSPIAPTEVSNSKAAVSQGAAKKVARSSSSSSAPIVSAVPSRNPHTASALNAVSANNSFLTIHALYPLGIGVGVAIFATIVVFVLKTLFQRYNGTNDQKE